LRDILQSRRKKRRPRETGKLYTDDRREIEKIKPGLLYAKHIGETALGRPGKMYTEGLHREDLGPIDPKKYQGDCLERTLGNCKRRPGVP
jgi:hypothetical protein